MKKHLDVPESSVGPSLAPVFKPGEDANAVRGELSEVLLARGAVTQQQLALTQQAMKQSPDRRLSEVLLEQGADEVAIHKATADCAGIVFERIDYKKGVDGGFDGKNAQRLTPEFCKDHMVMPLRQEGSRLVVAATRADDVFLLDVMTEFLSTPARFLHYLRMRLSVSNEVLVNHEFAALGYHLQTNMWATRR